MTISEALQQMRARPGSVWRNSEYPDIAYRFEKSIFQIRYRAGGYWSKIHTLRGGLMSDELLADWTEVNPETGEPMTAVDRPCWEELFQQINEWQKLTFPAATAFSNAKHIQKEIEREIIPDPENPTEWADALFLVIGASFVVCSDFKQVVLDKFKENKLRKWGKPDADGVVEHIRETGAEVGG
jgi:Protein of unknown function (DUF550)